MMKLHLNSSLILTAFILSGCASSPTLEQQARSEIKAAEIRNSAVEQAKEQQQQTQQAYLSEVPDWALQPKSPDTTGIYAVGIADSDKLQTALRKAMLQAEFQLAANFGQEISGGERSYVKDDKGETQTDVFIGLIDKLVEAVPVSGLEVTNRKVIVNDGRFTSFVQLKMPYEEFNKVLQSQRQQSADKAIQLSFDDLERRLDKRRKQRIEEAKVQQQVEGSFEK